MARIRTIKPDFPQSESMGRISRDARLLFVQLWTFADDSGRSRGSSRMLASVLFPFDDDAPNLIDGWMAELERESCVTRYMVDGTTYLQIKNWEKHQKIDKPSPSKIPSAPEKSEIAHSFREPSLNIREPSITDKEEEGDREGDIRDTDVSLVGDDADASEPIKLDRRRDELAKARETLSAFGAAWNETASRFGLPQIDEIKPGSTRERHALARLREMGGDFSPLLARIRGSPFLRGEKGWGPDFNWIVNATNFEKIMEGSYEDRQAQKHR